MRKTVKLKAYSGLYLQVICVLVSSFKIGVRMGDELQGIGELGHRPALVVVGAEESEILKDAKFATTLVSEQVIETNQRLLDTFRLAPLPVCFTVSNATEVDGRFNRLSNEPIFELKKDTSFSQPPLITWLQEQGADGLVIYGLSADKISTIATTALNNSVSVWVVEDACVEAVKESQLNDVDSNVLLKSTQEVIEHIAPDAELGDADYI